MKKTINDIFGKGLTAKAKLYLGTLQGTSTTLYFTAADVAAAILKNEWSHATIDEMKFGTKLVANIFSSIITTKSDANFHRSNGKMESKCVPPEWGYNVNASYGFRIGGTISIPLMNADIKAEQVRGKELAMALNNNPMEAIKGLLPGLLDNQLTDIVMEVLTIKEERMLAVRNELANSRKADNQAKAKAKIALENALANLEDA